MFPIDMKQPWTEIPGTEGLTATLLNGDFDEAAARGHRTRVVRFAPGGRTFEPFTHDYWEEVYLIEGSITTPDTGETVHAPAYVLRPPGTEHGPFVSEAGCLMLETQYFSDRSVGDTVFLDRKAPSAG